MANLSFNKGDWQRGVAKEAQLRLKNRYFEQNPVLSEDGAACIARPGLKKYLVVGSGPIRGTYAQEGSFNGDLFVVSGSEWYRVGVDDSVTLLQTGIAGGSDPVSMTITGDIDDVPEMAFLADGANLWLYMASSFTTVQFSGTVSNGDTILVGTTYYRWTTGSVDTGTPDGMLANPWLVAIGGSDANAFLNMLDALNNTGTAGTQYSTALNTANGLAFGYENTATYLTVQAFTIDSVVISKISGTVVATQIGEPGSPMTIRVPMPDNVGAISVGYIASNVVVVPAQGQGVNGRFYWIEPGETTVNPLNYATAERAPDPIFGVVVFGDQFWLPGSTTTEVWYFTGNQASPVERLRGITFDRGAFSGTALQVKDSMIIVDSDGGVFQVSGGLSRISDPSIEERIRKAIEVL